MMRPDRDNPASVAKVIASLIPEEVDQQVCLEFLANSISIAHALSPDRWGVTLSKDLIRLNVGNIEAIAIWPGILHCVLDLHSIPKKLWKDETVNLFKRDNNPELGIYKSVPMSVTCNMVVEEAEKVIPLIKNSHRILVENASQTRRHSMTKKAHSPAVIDYLSSYLGTELAQPKYVSYHGTKPITGEGASVLPIDFNAELENRIHRSAAKERIGLLGEQFIYEQEKIKLTNMSRQDLANKLKIVSSQSNLGYDILSFDKNGKEIHIEVKTTSKSENDNNEGFWMSDYEKHIAEQDKRWTLYRVWNIDAEPHFVNFGNIFRENAERWEASPSDWYVKRKAKNA